MKFLIITCIVIVGWLVGLSIVGIPAWLLWNWLMPTIFQLPKLSLIQALGLILMVGCFVRAHTIFKMKSSE